MLFYALHAVAYNGISFVLVYLKVSAQLITANHSTRSWVSVIHPTHPPTSYSVCEDTS